MSVIFFDNDEEHVEDMRTRIPNCHAIHVPDTEPNPRMGPLQGPPYNSHEYTARYYALFPGNSFLEKVRRAQGENYLPTRGITEEIIGQLNAWIDATPGKKIAIFDDFEYQKKHLFNHASDHRTECTEMIQVR
jgi:hypothetical protein